MNNNERKQAVTTSIGRDRSWTTLLGLGCTDPNPALPDKRVARLLVVLHDLNRSLAGLEDLSQTDLQELVSSAIYVCGFANPVETNCAIASVLRAIEAPGLPGSA
jgi:hypothetical protein